DHFVVSVERLLELVLHESDFAEIKLRVGSEVRVAVKPQIILKFLRREIVMFAVDVPQGVGIQDIRGSRGAGGGWGRSTGRDRRHGPARAGHGRGRSRAW